MIKAISIMGPTASGKTSLGIKLAKEINGEIISVDSALIYKGMDIGTAKPTFEEREGIVHHLIDILDPAESYSVAQFRIDAINLYNQIVSKGKVPIFVGGTMMYFKAITEGLAVLPSTPTEIREEVNGIISQKGLSYLRDLLKEVDIQSYERLNENDSQRLGRAYEVYLLTGKSMSEILASQQDQKPPFEMMQFAILPDRERKTLKPLIAQRFDKMLNDGFLEEVRRLYNRGDLSPDLPSIRCVGYRQMWQYLSNEVTFEQMRGLSIIATCQLAKRQMTWLRGWKTEVNYLTPMSEDNLQNICHKYMKNTANK
jgi:tRNA dimethylallyltransferase